METNLYFLENNVRESNLSTLKMAYFLQKRYYYVLILK